jgi:hypothetical protein
VPHTLLLDQAADEEHHRLAWDGRVGTKQLRIDADVVESDPVLREAAVEQAGADELRDRDEQPSLAHQRLAAPEVDAVASAPLSRRAIGRRGVEPVVRDDERHAEPPGQRKRGRAVDPHVRVEQRRSKRAHRAQQSPADAQLLVGELARATRDAAAVQHEHALARQLQASRGPAHSDVVAAVPGQRLALRPDVGFGGEDQSVAIDGHHGPGRRPVRTRRLGGRCRKRLRTHALTLRKAAAAWGAFRCD